MEAKAATKHKKHHVKIDVPVLVPYELNFWTWILIKTSRISHSAGISFVLRPENAVKLKVAGPAWIWSRVFDPPGSGILMRFILKF